MRSGLSGHNAVADTENVVLTTLISTKRYAPITGTNIVPKMRKHPPPIIRIILILLHLN